MLQALFYILFFPFIIVCKALIGILKLIGFVDIFFGHRD